MIPYSFDYTGDGSAHTIASKVPTGYPTRAKWFQIFVKTGTGPEYFGDVNIHDDGTGGVAFTTSTPLIPPVAELTGVYDFNNWKFSIKNNDKVTVLYVL